MKFEFTLHKEARRKVLTLVSDLSVNQLNHIPDGFNNNLIWNLGHLVVTQQILVYKLSGLPIMVPESWVDQFKKGSSPKGILISEDEIATIKSKLFSLSEQTEIDFEAGLFLQYTTYQTSFGVTLTSAADAIRFNNLHESMHLGYMIAMKRLVVQ